MPTPLDTVMLKVQGTVTIPEYARALALMSRMLAALTKFRAGTGALSWEVESLSGTSANTLARGNPRRHGKIVQLRQVVTDWAVVGDKMRTGAPAREYPEDVQAACEGFRELVSNDRTEITKLWFENPLREVPVLRLVDRRPDPEADLMVSYGSVRGWVEAITKHAGLRFTLYDRLHHKAVSCYVAEGNQELLRNLWGRYVAVEGIVRRERESGRVISVREIVHAAPEKEGKPDAWRAAVGCAPSKPGDISSEEAIRRVRDRDDA